jgi:hypothetical protein
MKASMFGGTGGTPYLYRLRRQWRVFKSAANGSYLGSFRPSIRESPTLALTDCDLCPRRIGNRSVIPPERELVTITIEVLL